jgi:L-fucose isomerase-like protein
MSIMDVFYQNEIKFTALKPHTVSPTSPKFAEHVDYFDRVCRVVRGVGRMTVGAVGARSTPFKTVRIDEVALQRAGITVETFDLSDIFYRMKSIGTSDAAYKDKAELLKKYTNFSKVKDSAFENIVKLGVVLDQLIEEWNLDAVAIRCWLEMQQQLGISPCVLLSEMNNRFLTASCEVDIGNAVAMHALSMASGDVSACLDWNNNYEDEDDKCILFHCGPVPQSMMVGQGTVTGHAILDNGPGISCSDGCNTGRIKPGNFTFGSMMTDSGWLKWYLGDGEFTTDPIPANFFGCAGVAKINDLQDVLLFAGREGYRHHVSVTPSVVVDPLKEALGYYLEHDVSVVSE